jgi:hypothetical protein
LIFTSCKKTENPIKFPKGTFPTDTAIALTDLNSPYNDFNTDCHFLYGNFILVFSSDRISTGEQFDLVQGIITVEFDQTNGNYGLGCEMTSDAFLTKLLTAANTTRDEFGPYRLSSPVDGYEYLLLASRNTSGDLDFYYLRNMPYFGGATLPAVQGPYPATLLNTSSDDAYICFDLNQDSAYFSSDVSGNFNIYVKKRPAATPIDLWLNGTYSASTPVDSLNSGDQDKCPNIFKKVMVFASDRPGGMGGFDLYYSVFKNGKWSTPNNFGPSVNTASNEYRPVIGTHSDFTNYMMVFSSDRPGGKGGYDLYSVGVTITE